jgi:hypothetical protein
LFANPSFQFDASVGLIVIAFHDSADKLISSIPSQQQLDAYRSHQQTPPGEQTTQATPSPPPPIDAKAASG